MEKSLYQPVKTALEVRFIREFGECYLEITANKKISDKIKKCFDDIVLHIINVEGFYPDLMGLIQSKEIIVVEVKEELTLKDIYQAKQYGEIFNAKYTLLIYSEPLSEEIRRFLEKRPEILSHSAGSKDVKLARFDKTDNDIEEGTWYMSSPFL